MLRRGHVSAGFADGRQGVHRKVWSDGFVDDLSVVSKWIGVACI